MTPGSTYILSSLALTVLLFAVVLYTLARERQVLRLRSELTSNISHELRTPLAEILLFAETLEMDRARNETARQEAVRIIAQQARHLSHIVENVLLFSRAERKQLRIEPEVASLAGTIRSILECFTPLAASCGATLKLELTEGILVPAHRGALEQILLNLLENAVKYGPAGQAVTIRTEFEFVSGAARISVEDEGPGIPVAERRQVWEPFVRLAGTNGGKGGSGIGLAVVRELVLGHRGRCWIDSSRTGGARVTIELPEATMEGAVRGDRPNLLYLTR